MPHITLAHGDVDLDRLRCALSSLTAGTNAWEIQIDNLVLIALHESREAEVHRYPFGGS